MSVTLQVKQLTLHFTSICLSTNGPLLVGDLDNNIVEDLLDSQMNLFQNSSDGFEFNEGTIIIVSFYDIPDVAELRRGREAVNLTLY